VTLVSRRRSALPRAFRCRDPNSPCRRPEGRDDALGRPKPPMPGSLQARFSMLLAFDDAHGHAARPHIPFDLTSDVSAGLPGISAEHPTSVSTCGERTTRLSQGHADPFPISQHGWLGDSPLTRRVARASLSQSTLPCGSVTRECASANRLFSSIARMGRPTRR